MRRFFTHGAYFGLGKAANFYLSIGEEKGKKKFFFTSSWKHVDACIYPRSCAMHIFDK